MNEYEQLVDAYYQVAINPKDNSLLGKAVELSKDFDPEIVEDAKREACVMAVLDSKMQA